MYLDCVGVYTTVCVCQNAEKVHLRTVTPLSVNYTSLNMIFKKDKGKACYIKGTSGGPGK